MANATQSIFNKNRGYVGNQNSSATAVEEKERKRAKNKEPLYFEGTFDTKYVSSRELARDINTVFEGLFSDFYGSLIRVVPSPNGGNTLDLELYFRPSTDESTEGTFKAFETAASQFKTGGPQIKNLIHQATLAGRNEKTFVLTSIASELLYDFMHDDAKKQIKWDNPSSYDKFISIIEDKPNVMVGGTGTLYMCIKVEILQVLKFVYGEKQGKSGIIYAATPITPVRTAAYPMQNMAGCNWILSITKMTWDQYHKIMNELGVNVNPSSLDVIVAEKYK